MPRRSFAARAGLLHNRVVTRKLLVARLGAGSITVAFCAVLPGCNLAIRPTDCVGDPSSREMSAVDCPDAQAGTGGASDGARDAVSEAVDDALADQSGAERP